MAEDFPISEECLESGKVSAQVGHPDGRIHENHDYVFLDLLLGIERRPFSVPPSRASLRLLSGAIKVFSPIRTSDVFSSILVKAEALSKSSLSILMVVLICIYMNDICISVKPFFQYRRRFYRLMPSFKPFVSLSCAVSFRKV